MVPIFQLKIALANAWGMFAGIKVLWDTVCPRGKAHLLIDVAAGNMTDKSVNEKYCVIVDTHEMEGHAGDGCGAMVQSLKDYPRVDAHGHVHHDWLFECTVGLATPLLFSVLRSAYHFLLAANAAARARIKTFEILDLDEGMSDHAALVIEFKMPAGNLALRAPIPQRSNTTRARPRALHVPPKVNLPNTSEIDRLFIQVLASKLTPEQKLDKLFGPATVTSNPVEVYIDGSCFNNGRDNATAGSDSQTNNCSETLYIWTDSEYAMETIAN
ncbi:hypothetical protein B0H10DRAFT_2217956 [Mycena sp. CBHHK59/15]|nr:hypothetical protein B0H10DRAFT_2217956 [Mycena sp. CBHHK59/15]